MGPVVEQVLLGLSEADIDASWAQALPEFKTYIRQFETIMAAVGIQYYDAVRALSVSGSTYSSTLPDLAPEEKYDISMGVTGPTEIKKAIKNGADFDTARSKAFVTLSGATQKILADTGRSGITTNSTKDKAAVGWQRLSTTGTPCYFCALLISRGPVYKNAATAGKLSDVRFVGEGKFKVHDHCSCYAEPLFTDKNQTPPSVQKYDDIYQEATRHSSGQDAINAFRRAYEAQMREDKP